MENPSKAIAELSSVEELAEEVLRSQSEVVAMDKRRNSNREGIRALKNAKCKKSFVTIGPNLVKLPNETAIRLLERDQKELDLEINKTRSDLKVKVNKLRDLEYMPPVTGLDLNPLSREEMSAVGQIFGRHA